MIHLRADSPFRPVDWRWQKATALRAAQRRQMRGGQYDRLVEDAMRFQAVLASVSTDWDLVKLAQTQSHLFDAHEIRNRNEATGCRWEIEARLLAEQPLAEIAQRMGHAVETIRTYEALFFHVTDKLAAGAKGWVIQSVLGPSFAQGVAERHYDLLWKMYGLLFGARVLDAVLEKSACPQKAESRSQVAAVLSDDTRNMILLKANLAAKTIPVNTFTQIPLLELATRLQEAEMKAKQSDPSGTGTAYGSVMREVMEGLPWSVGGGSDARPTPVRMAEAEASAAELRADEAILVAAGRTESMDLVSGVHYPEATDDRAAPE